MAARLKEYYKNEVASELMRSSDIRVRWRYRSLVKIVVNVGSGEIKDNPKALDAIINDLSLITGQRPVATIAKNPYQTSSCVPVPRSARR